MAYFFEWDPAKADANAGKHGVTFDEASTVFGNPLALLMLDPEHSANEQRHLLLGMSSQQRLRGSLCRAPAADPSDFRKASDPTRAEAI